MSRFPFSRPIILYLREVAVLALVASLTWAPTIAAQAGPFLDPGTGPWELVDEDDIEEVCRLDYDLLNDALIPADAAFAIIRYGRLCYVSGLAGADAETVTQAWSATKSLGALLTGMVMYDTRDLPPSSERMTGPLTEWDRMDKWLDFSTIEDEDFDIHPDATVAHVLAMVGYSDDLSHGAKNHRYDTTGSREVNYLIDVVNNVVRQDPARLGANAVGAKDRLFRRLGIEHSSWDVRRYGYGWQASLLDMARVGLVMLHGGVYGGERIADAQYVYNMTHPAFEDGSLNYGYLTWMNNTTCSPRAVHRSYPHGLSEATDCADGNCDQDHDVGVWNAAGRGGQYIIGHRALDMVVVGNNWDNGGSSALWRTVLPSVVAGDPRFQGDVEAFCEAYSAGSYAPDLVLWEDGI